MLAGDEDKCEQCEGVVEFRLFWSLRFIFVTPRDVIEKKG